MIKKKKKKTYQKNSDLKKIQICLTVLNLSCSLKMNINTN